MMIRPACDQGEEVIGWMDGVCSLLDRGMYDEAMGAIGDMEHEYPGISHLMTSAAYDLLGITDDAEVEYGLALRDPEVRAAMDFMEVKLAWVPGE